MVCLLYSCNFKVRPLAPPSTRIAAPKFLHYRNSGAATVTQGIRERGTPYKAEDS